MVGLPRAPLLVLLVELLAHALSEASEASGLSGRRVLVIGGTQFMGRFTVADLQVGSAEPLAPSRAPRTRKR